MKLKIKSRLAGVLALSFLMLAIAPVRVKADTLYDNLPGNNAFTSVLSTSLLAMGITVGDTGISLDSITLTLKIQGDDFYLNLYSDNGSKPGNSLEALSPTESLQPGTANYTFTPDSPFTLLAGATYWIVGSGSGTSLSTAPGWMNSATTAVIAPDITFAGVRGSSDAGNTWRSVSGQRTLLLEGTIAPAPEPSTIALSMAGGFALLAGYRRRRTK